MRCFSTGDRGRMSRRGDLPWQTASRHGDLPWQTAWHWHVSWHLCCVVHHTRSLGVFILCFIYNMVFVNYTYHMVVNTQLHKFFIYIMQTLWCWKRYISWCSIGIGFWRLMRTSTFGIEWGVMRSFVLKQGSVLLAGFDGCSWGIAFCWKYVGSSVGYLYALRCWCGCWRLSADTRYVHLAWGRLPSVAVVIVSCTPHSMARDAGYLVLKWGWVLEAS